MQSINITQVNGSNWYIAVLKTITGKSYIGFGTSKIDAIENLKIEFNK
jgi:hypothetical protein